MSSDDKNLTLDELIQKYSSLKFNEEKTKVICEWSGHEMPLRTDSVLLYLSGNRYKNLSQAKINQDELKKYSEFLITKKNQRNKNQLFCLLTLKYVNKRPDHLQTHVSGRKFQKAYKHWLYCQENNQKFVPFSKQVKIKKAENMDQDIDEEDDMNKLFSDMNKTDEEEEDDLATDNEDDDTKSVDSMSDLFPEDKLKGVDKNAEVMAKMNLVSKKSLKNLITTTNIEDDLMGCDINDNYQKKNGNSEFIKNDNGKRKFDSKINKKLKIEPQRKKSNI